MDGRPNVPSSIGRLRLGLRLARVGNSRVLFLLAGDAIQVYAVKDRKEAYE